MPRTLSLALLTAVAAVLPSSAHATCHDVDCLDSVSFVLCDVRPGQGLGVPPYAETRPDGDVYVAGELVWDCPPYEPYD